MKVKKKRYRGGFQVAYLKNNIIGIPTPYAPWNKLENHLFEEIEVDNDHFFLEVINPLEIPLIELKTICENSWIDFSHVTGLSPYTEGEVPLAETHTLEGRFKHFCTLHCSRSTLKQYSRNFKRLVKMDLINPKESIQDYKKKHSSIEREIVEKIYGVLEGTISPTNTNVPGLQNHMKLFNTLFDVPVTRLLFHKTLWKNHWENFINTLLLHEPDWENGEHLLVTPHSLWVESIGVSLKKINTELEKSILAHKEILASYRTGQDPDCDLLDALMWFCGSFYENHPFLSIDVLTNLADVQFKHFSTVHPLGQPMHQLIIEDWKNVLEQPSGHKELCKSLSWDAVGRFVDICRFSQNLEERKQTSQKRDLSLLKGWADLLTQAQRNLSAYRFVSRICNRDNSGWGTLLRPTKGLSLLDDAGDCDILHAFVFGNFSYFKKIDKTSHYSVVVFVRKEEAEVFLARAKLYKTVLESLQESMGLGVSLKPGMAYLVDSKTCGVVGGISGTDMLIRWFPLAHSLQFPKKLSFKNGVTLPNLPIIGDHSLLDPLSRPCPSLGPI